MPGSWLDRYGRGRSVCHRLPSRWKVLIAFAIVLASLLTPPEQWPFHGVLLAIVFGGHALANIPTGYLLRRVALFLPLVVMMSIAVPLSHGFAEGWSIMAAILLRSVVSFTTMLWLVNVMPFDELLQTLRKCWVPAVLIAMLSFMYRYLFVLWEELDRMRRARSARSLSNRSVWFRWMSAGQLIGMLLIRSLSRAERVHGAMRARGWDGRVRHLD